jgi:hypothetical protein
MNRIILRFTLVGAFLVGFSYWSMAQTNLIKDGSFEGGIPNAAWNESSTNFGSPLCRIISCGNGGGSDVPHTGNIWAWFGGAGTYSEISSIDQTVTIPNGTNELIFWFQNTGSSGSGNDYLQVQIDDTPVWTVNEGNPAYTNYTEVKINIDAYANGQPHKIEFYSVCYGSGNTNFSVDDVSLTSGSPVPVSWLGVFFVFLIIGSISFYRFKKSKSFILYN